MSAFTGLFIAACWAVAAIYIAIASLGAKRTAETSGEGNGWWWCVALPLGIIGAILLLPFSGAHHVPAIGIIADLVALLGLIVVVWARTVLGGNWSTRAVLKENHELIQRGPYRYVRHPMYSSLLLLTLGGLMWNGDVTGIAVLMALFAGFWLKARQEERLLTKHFPDAYPRYKARVKAFIPFVF